VLPKTYYKEVFREGSTVATSAPIHPTFAAGSVSVPVR
jgi:hypothetical protein